VLAVVGEVGELQHLHRGGRAGRDVPGLVDLAGAAAADQHAELEAADDLVGEPAGRAAAGGAPQVESDLVDQRLALAEAVERAALAALRVAKPQRALQTNVEFYTAVLLHSLGIDRTLFTCVFAVGRVGGWIAHAQEQVRLGRLIRPQSRYVGPMPRQAA